MHPNPRFHWEDRDAMRALVGKIAFGALFTHTPEGPRVAHVPAIWLDDDYIGMHVARGNAITRHLDGASALFVVQGPDSYVSPDWYGLGQDEVPTWNYVTIELEGRCVQMDRDALVAQIDRLTAEQEARLAPKRPWTRAKSDPDKIDKMFDAVIGFTLEIEAWRGTRKLGQNKAESARLSAADRLEAQGRGAIAQWMRHPE
jgi:transcriptional regulator